MDPRTRRWAQRALYRLDANRRRVMEIREGDPMAERFASFGAGSTIEHPQIALGGLHGVSVGREVHIRSHVCIEAMSPYDQIVLRLGDRIHIGYYVRFVALNGIEVGNDVGVGHGCTLTDTIHEWKTAEEDQGLSQTPLKVGRPLRIGDGAWLGNNTVVTGGITVGDRAVVGPNAVINRDVPSNTVVLGNPPRIVRRKRDDGEWEWLVDPAVLDLETVEQAEERQGPR